LKELHHSAHKSRTLSYPMSAVSLLWGKIINPQTRPNKIITLNFAIYSIPTVCQTEPSWKTVDFSPAGFPARVLRLNLDNPETIQLSREYLSLLILFLIFVAPHISTSFHPYCSSEQGTIDHSLHNPRVKRQMFIVSWPDGF
jgi:hypothetical protein